MKKLLIWDGDETLWRGTLLEGEKPTLPSGRLELCQMLGERGVLQAVASRNKIRDVDQTLMSLGLDQWFLHSRADQTAMKSDLISAIVEAYGLTSLSDVAFVDDDPMNREQVLESLPEVAVVSPEDIAEMIAEHFTKESYTDEDRLRVRRYRAEVQRLVAASAYDGDHTAFLRTCNIVMRITTATPDDLPRVWDLVQRAHRMAALGEDYSENDWRRLIVSESVKVARVSDKFGDYGLSALLAHRYEKVEAIVVSCRLQGRGIGSALLGYAINELKIRVAYWCETEYNVGVRNLYEWYKFNTVNRYGILTAERQSEDAVVLPDWIKIEAQ